MTTEAQKKTRLLFETANSQQGFFTAKQATLAGYLASNFAYHVDSGNWIKMGWGIYRLRNYPSSAEERFALFSLWSRNRKNVAQGVILHSTALLYHRLSTKKPAQINMTVPTAFRRSAKTPSELLLFYSNFEKHEVEEKLGFSVTTPCKTLIDVFRNGMPIDSVKKRFKIAVKKGLISADDIYWNEIPADLRSVFEDTLRLKSGTPR